MKLGKIWILKINSLPLIPLNINSPTKPRTAHGNHLQLFEESLHQLLHGIEDLLMFRRCQLQTEPEQSGCETSMKLLEMLGWWVVGLWWMVDDGWWLRVDDASWFMVQDGSGSTIHCQYMQPYFKVHGDHSHISTILAPLVIPGPGSPGHASRRSLLTAVSCHGMFTTRRWHFQPSSTRSWRPAGQQPAYQPVTINRMSIRIIKHD